MAERVSPDEATRRYEEARRRTLAAFPFERIETTGERAYDEWRRIRWDGLTCVIVGSDEHFERLAEPFSPDWPMGRSAHETLTLAAGLTHPESLIAERKAMSARLQTLLDDAPFLPADGGAPQTLAASEYINELLKNFEAARSLDPPRFVVPDDPDLAGLSIICDYRTGRSIDKANLVIIPTDDWTTIPAHLRWGGWNDCPAPEFHVAALRHWRDLFGAELVGLGPDTMNLKVARRPASPEAALSLAHEHYTYCADLVDQGSGKIEDLSAALLAEDWWYFWWD